VTEERYPVIYIDGSTDFSRTVKWDRYTLHLGAYMRGESGALRQRAVRQLDSLAHHGSAAMTDWAAILWLKFKGYVAITAMKVDSWRGEWQFVITDSGRDVLVKEAAPVGEW